jgi:hypothetical protein
MNRKLECIKGIEKTTRILNQINTGENRVEKTSDYLSKLQQLSKLINDVESNKLNSNF